MQKKIDDKIDLVKEKRISLFTAGTLQCIVGISAIRSRNGVRLRGENLHVIIHGLKVSSTQRLPFVDEIRRIATVLVPGCTVTDLAPEALTNAKEAAAKVLGHPSSQLLRAALGIPDCDEQYFIRNWDSETRLLMCLSPDAFCICYGDTFGMWISAEYFAPKFSRWDRVRNSIRDSQEALAARVRYLRDHNYKSALVLPPPERRFDLGLFVVKNGLGSPPPKPFDLYPTDFILQEMQKLARSTVFPREAVIKSTLSGEIIVLLTSSIAEMGRISSANEVHAYIDFLLERNVKTTASIVIKPHPRDDPGKIATLEAEMRKVGFKQVITLTEAEYYFCPFEIAFVKLFADLTVKPRIFAVSTACLTLLLLHRADCEIGFGDAIVKKYFDLENAIPRMVHEHDMRLLFSAFQ